MSQDKPDALPAREPTEVLAGARVIAGRYKLGRLLGEGGMGAVYQATHIELNRQVAVKLLSDAFVSHPTATKRARREARATAAIDHRNIVKVFDTGNDERGVPYLVMELMRGESLGALLKIHRQLTVEQGCAIASESLAGLHAAHEVGVVHRDLKPGNIFLAVQPGHPTTLRVKVLDFGVSKFADGVDMELTATGIAVGTPHYMSPEQLTGSSDLDCRSDIYSMGVLLYRMLCGRLPFHGKSGEARELAILRSDFPPPQEFNKRIDDRLNNLILRVMSQRPGERFTSADEFRHALLPYLKCSESEDEDDTLLEISRVLRTLPVHALEDARSRPRTSTGTPFEHTPEDSLSSETVPESPSALGKQDSSADSGQGGLRPTVTQGGAPTTGLALATPAPPSRKNSLKLGIGMVLAGALLVGVVVGVIAYMMGVKGKHAPAAQVYEGPALTLGMTTYVPEAVQRHMYEPVTKHLSQALERQVELKVFADSESLEREFLDKKLEFAALNPASYLKVYSALPSVGLLAAPQTPGGSSFEVHIVSRGDAGYHDLSDLKDKVFCFVPSAASGFQIPRQMLRDAGIDPGGDLSSDRLADNHIAGLRYVINGKCDATAVYGSLLYEASKHGMRADMFRILATSPRIPNDAYCAQPDLDESLRKRTQSALLDLSAGSQAAKDVFPSDSAITGFVEAVHSDYATIQKWLVEGQIKD